MATIYDYQTATTISDGLRGRAVCDEAMQCARELACDRQQPVVLEDDGDFFVVSPDGAVRQMGERERRSGGWASEA